MASIQCRVRAPGCPGSTAIFRESARATTLGVSQSASVFLLEGRHGTGVHTALPPAPRCPDAPSGQQRREYVHRQLPASAQRDDIEHNRGSAHAKEPQQANGDVRHRRDWQRAYARSNARAAGGRGRCGRVCPLQSAAAADCTPEEAQGRSELSAAQGTRRTRAEAASGSASLHGAPSLPRSPAAVRVRLSAKQRRARVRHEYFSRRQAPRKLAAVQQLSFL